MMAEQGRNMSLNCPVVHLQLLFVCFVKTVQFIKCVTCKQRDRNNPIQGSGIALCTAIRSLWYLADRKLSI